MNQRHFDIRVFAEGIRIPALGVDRQQAGAQYSFTVRIPPTEIGMRPPPNTLIHVFVRDEQGVYRIFCEGRVKARSSQKSREGGTTASLVCESFLQDWDQFKLGFDVGQDLGGGQKRLRRLFLGMSAGEGELYEGYEAAGDVANVGAVAASTAGASGEGSLGFGSSGASRFFDFYPALMNLVGRMGPVSALMHVAANLPSFSPMFRQLYNATKLNRRIAFSENQRISAYLAYQTQTNLALFEGRVQSLPPDASLLTLFQAILPDAMHNMTSIASPTFRYKALREQALLDESALAAAKAYEAEDERRRHPQRGRFGINAPTVAGISGDGVQRIIAVSESYEGTPYAWGGNTRAGMDCSHFVQTVFREAFDVSVPAPTSNQIEQGTKIELADIKGGDIVLFHSPGGRGGGRHVGIYIGNSQMTHCGRSRGANSRDAFHLDGTTSYYNRIFTQARRVVDPSQLGYTEGFSAPGTGPRLPANPAPGIATGLDIAAGLADEETTPRADRGEEEYAAGRGVMARPQTASTAFDRAREGATDREFVGGQTGGGRRGTTARPGPARAAQGNGTEPTGGRVLNGVRVAGVNPALTSSNTNQEVSRDPRILAFLDSLAYTESGTTIYMNPASYAVKNLANGGGTITDFSRHPNYGVKHPACGRYQFLGSTWKDLVDRNKIENGDFSPRSQDIGAIAKIRERGALPDILAGNITQAVADCRLEWTSLPGAKENLWTSRGGLPGFISLYNKHLALRSNGTALPIDEGQGLLSATPGAPGAPPGVPADPEESRPLYFYKNFAGALPSIVIKPDLYFAPPPVCNVIFPDQIASYDASELYEGSPTRLMMYGNPVAARLSGTDAFQSLVVPLEFAPRYLQNIFKALRAGGENVAANTGDVATTDEYDAQEDYIADFITRMQRAPGADLERYDDPNFRQLLFSQLARKTTETENAEVDIVRQILVGAANDDIPPGLAGLFTWDELFRGIIPSVGQFPYLDTDGGGSAALYEINRQLIEQIGGNEELMRSLFVPMPAMARAATTGSEPAAADPAVVAGLSGQTVRAVTRPLQGEALIDSAVAALGGASGPRLLPSQVATGGTAPAATPAPTAAEAADDAGTAPPDVPEQPPQLGDSPDPSVSATALFANYKFAISRRQGRQARLQLRFNTNVVCGFPMAFYEPALGWVVGNVASVQDHIDPAGSAAFTNVSLTHCMFVADYEDEIFSRMMVEAEAEGAQLDAAGFAELPIFYDNMYSASKIGNSTYQEILGIGSIVDWSRRAGLGSTLRDALKGAQRRYEAAADPSGFSESFGARNVGTEGDVMQMVLGARPRGSAGVGMNPSAADHARVSGETHEMYAAPYSALNIPTREQSFMTQRSDWARRYVADLIERQFAHDAARS